MLKTSTTIVLFQWTILLWNWTVRMVVAMYLCLAVDDCSILNEKSNYSQVTCEWRDVQRFVTSLSQYIIKQQPPACQSPRPIHQPTHDATFSNNARKTLDCEDFSSSTDLSVSYSRTCNSTWDFRATLRVIEHCYYRASACEAVQRAILI